MEFLASLYTILLVTICLLLAVLLHRTGKKPTADHNELKQWLAQQLEAQAKDFAKQQQAMAEQNSAAIRLEPAPISCQISSIIMAFFFVRSLLILSQT